MWSVRVVVDPPFFDDAPSFGVVAEQMLIKALVAEAAIEAFDETVLLRLARRDIVPGDAAIFLPAQDRMRRQLSAVVADDGPWKSSITRDAVKFAGDADARDGVVGDKSYAFSTEVIDHCQYAEAPAIRQGVCDKVQAPTLVGALRQRHWRSCS